MATGASQNVGSVQASAAEVGGFRALELDAHKRQNSARLMKL